MNSIPKVIHQIHLGGKEFSDKQLKWQKSWKDYNPDWEYILWDYQKILKNLDINHLNILNQCKNFSEKSDILRFEILYNYGGLYIDTDFECLKNIDPLFENDKDLLVYEQSSGIICGAFFAASKENNLVKKLIDGIPERFSKFKNSDSHTKFGPAYLSKVLRGFSSAYGRDFVYPFSWDEKIRSNENFKLTKPKAYAVHHWACSWSNNESLDLSENLKSKKLGPLDNNFWPKAYHNCHDTNKQDKIAIIVWNFPNRSNTFVMNEIIELYKKGLDFVIYSMHQPTEECKSLYKKELSLIGDRIVSIPGRSLLDFKSLKKDCIAFYENDFRQSLELCKSNDPTKEFYNQQEQECVQRSKNFLKQFIKDIESKKITKIYAPFGNGDAEISMMISYHTGIPYYFTTHAYDLFCNYYYTRMKAKTVSHVFTISEYNKNYLIQELGIPEEKITVRRINFLSPDQDSILEKKFNYPYIFSAGRLCEMKGFEYSIKAFSEFHKKYPDVHYIIVGCGDLEVSLKKMIGDLDLHDFVHMAGHVKNHEVLEYVKGSLYSILSSIEMPNKDKEGLPTCFVESMSLGVPCVGTDYSGIPELIDHEINGMLIKEKNTRDIFLKMCKLYEMIKNDNTGSISKSCKLKVSSMFNNEENINLLLEHLK